MANVTLFSQIIGKLDKIIFNKLVKTKQTDKYAKGFTSWTHLVSMLFAKYINNTNRGFCFESNPPMPL